MPTTEQIYAALEADGHRSYPAIGSMWQDNRHTWLPEGRRRLARVTGIWKIQSGWSVVFDAWTAGADDREESNSARQYLNHFMNNFTPVEGQ